MIRNDDALVIPANLPRFGLKSRMITFSFLPSIGIVIHRKGDGYRILKEGMWIDGPSNDEDDVRL